MPEAKKQGGGSSSRKAQINQSQPIITFHPEMTTFLLFYFSSFLSCPCLGVRLAGSHIPSPSLPAQTPCGVPFPRCGTRHNGVTHTFAKLIKCGGDRESQPRLREAAAAAPPRFPLPGPRGRVSQRLPVTEPQLPLTGPGSNRGRSNGKCHGTLGGMCWAASGSLSF